jgi:cytidine deaminase
MTNLINHMIRKRIGETSSFNKKHDHYKHAAAITTRKGRVLTIGGNKYHSTIKHGYTIHAEVDTIQRSLRPAFIKYGRSLNKRRIPVDITVIRTSLVNSHPCLHCINAMASNPVFAIKRIYYSNDGDITYSSMSSLLETTNPHVSKANRGSSSCCCDEDDCSDEEGEGKEALCGLLDI